MNVQIRTEEQIESEESRLNEAVTKIGDTTEERLQELVRLCVEERYDRRLVDVIMQRTQRVTGVAGTMQVPLVWPRHSGCCRDW